MDFDELVSRTASVSTRRRSRIWTDLNRQMHLPCAPARPVRPDR